MLFMPKSVRGLKIDYPELNDYEELKALDRKSLWFVWLYACKSSPYFDIDKKSEREIVELCVNTCGMRFDDPAKREKFLDRNFPEKIQAAIPIMNSFEPSVRMLAKLSAIRSLENVKKMTSLTLDEHGNHVQFLDKDGNIDFNKKKQYMSMVMDKEKKIGEIIQKAEQGYGLSIAKKGGNKNLDDNGWTFLETFHQNH